MVERRDRTDESNTHSMLKTMVSENDKNWDTMLQKALLHYRSSVHSSTGFTPYRLMFGREMRLPIDTVIHRNEETENTLPQYVIRQKELIEATEELAREHTQAAQRRQKYYYDNKQRGSPFRKGDLVMLYSSAIPVSKSKKFFKR